MNNVQNRNDVPVNTGWLSRDFLFMDCDNPQYIG